MAESILSDLCAALDFMVLQPSKAGNYRAAAAPPSWWQTIDPQGLASAGRFQVGDELPFLREFLKDVDPCWDQLADQWHASGVWQEVFADGSSSHFEASASRINGQRILLIKRVDIHADDLAVLIQKGRENKLAYQLDIAQRERLEVELRRAKEAAEQLTRAKSDFLARMTHELRTPMNGVIGMTHLLLESNPTDEQQGYLEAVHDSATALLRIIDDILDFSKGEAGKLVLDKVSFSLRDAVHDTLRLLEVSARHKGLQMTCEIHPSVPDQLVGDPLRLRQILVNLIGNAVKFTEAGCISLEIQTEPRASEKGCLRFSIRDTGIGIPLESQERIFDSFVQVDAASHRRQQGTGLGLSIVAQLVDLMGGRIWVANSSEQGTTFCFTARYELQDPGCMGAHGAGIAKTASASQSAQPSQPLRILVADDNPMNQRVATSLLEKRGHSVAIADNGLRVLEMLDRNRFDVILMDCQMPEMDGFETTVAIRKREESADGHRIPIIALTAQADGSDQQRCLQAGMDAYASKPFDARRLLGLIEQLCQGRTAEMIPSQL